MAAEEAREAGKDPFRVTDQRREAVHGELFKRQIHRRDLKAIKQIGAGQFGDVWSATQTVAPGQGDNGSNSIQRAVKLLRGAATLSDKEVLTHATHDCAYPHCVPRVAGVSAGSRSHAPAQ